ncbi:MAG: NAD(+)/NADH kinase [Clostridiales bacterium]|jgi:NAD+ kinase|nr:NAD(+)/NADH kinase [Clostridiales bacterium]
MKNIGIVYNTDKDKALGFRGLVYQRVAALGCRPLLDTDDIYTVSDFIVVLGGDGTMLQAAHQAARADIPLLGVNLGSLGYLTDIEPGEIDEALAAVLQGRFRLERRIMLRTDLNDKWAALNDIVIGRGIFSKLIRFQLYINDEYIDTIRADGVIISTPTGATAYNLSAGGPILKPESEMMVITAICPHALHLRPWVISAGDTVGVRVLNEADAMLTMDGRNMAALEVGQLLSVKRSSMYTSIIKTKPLGFYEILRRKMILSDRGEMNGESQETPRQDY